MEIALNFLLALLSLTLAAVLAAADAAFSTVSHHEVEEAVEDGKRTAPKAERILKDLPTHINVLTFVRQLFETAAVVFTLLGFTSFIDSMPTALIVTALTSAVAVFVIAGVSPRTIGRRKNLTVVLASAPLVSGLRQALGPVARVLVWLGNMLTPAKVFRDGPFVTEEQLRDLVDRASAGNIIEDDERDMIESVFNLGDTRAYKVMVPRPDLVYLRSESTLEHAMTVFLRSGFSRIPVVGKDLDDVRGIVFLKDVARRLHTHPEDRDQPALDIARPVTFVPDTKTVDSLLRFMQVEATHMVIIVDEYGGTAGLITIEDIVEEIVGEIADEYDRDEDDIVPLEGGGARVATRTDIEDVAEYFDVRIDEEDVTTVGGLLASELGEVPIAGSEAVISGLRLVAEPGQGRRHRISHVIITREEE
ncbi:hemolysin family protein [Brevibacterium ravenspurgense]|uniref:Magnesium and cobalt efflux protein CorC n=1 Tax=Brevibacterium ravenspurgense TaxID=479117 RepID=A0A150H7S6_9MICO|nr:hemolysin family protein [Brevibacterium ravenspurgense]KXZ58055.1 Magnesium and cobalt efflux protein CorC [Brevibacterium ravenspurgense]MCG7299701.1 hemolysin family protein [Brevibacterium ravenspurgense]